MSSLAHTDYTIIWWWYVFVEDGWGSSFNNILHSKNVAHTTSTKPAGLLAWSSLVQREIPKHAFISWIVVRNRMSTRDRLRRWGTNVPLDCLLCSGSEESRQHLFFDCSYSSEVWSFFCSRLHLSPPNLFEDCLRWMKDPTTDDKKLLIIRIIFQIVIYVVWKERNSRLYTRLCRPGQMIIHDIKQTLWLRLDPLSRSIMINSSSASTPLGYWLNIF